jgi:hypothetical protein
MEQFRKVTAMAGSPSRARVLALLSRRSFFTHNGALWGGGVRIGAEPFYCASGKDGALSWVRRSQEIPLFGATADEQHLAGVPRLSAPRARAPARTTPGRLVGAWRRNQRQDDRRFGTEASETEASETEASERSGPAEATPRLAAQRYKIQFQASQEYVDLLEKATDLLPYAARTRALEEVHLRAMRLRKAENQHLIVEHADSELGILGTGRFQKQRRQRARREPVVASTQALSRLAQERAAADAEEGRCLLAALRSAAHAHLGFGSFGEYVERMFGYKPRAPRRKARSAHEQTLLLRSGHLRPRGMLSIQP